MKKMMNKCWSILTENVMLLGLVLGIGLGVFFLLWHESITRCLRMITSVEYINREYWKDADCIDNKIIIRGQSTYLLDEYTGEILAGPYAWIVLEDFDFAYHIARYIEENNLIGFINDNGNVITPPVYTDATRFLENGQALVRDQDGNQYAIGTDGEVYKGMGGSNEKK